MQRGHSLEFVCESCSEPVRFSIFDLDHQREVKCSKCQKRYLFDDAILIRQLKKFDALCRQIRESEEILGSTAVGIDVGQTQVKIPFKLLLTRLSSCLDLQIGGKPFSIAFRFEPISDTPL